MLESISLALQGLWTHKMRSFLTMLGVIIGIASIITIVSTINGTNQQIKDNLVGAGNNVVNVRVTQDGNPVEFSYMAIPASVRPLDADVADYLGTLPGVDSVALFRSNSGGDAVSFGRTQFTGNLYGIDERYLSVVGSSVARGRAFTEEDRVNNRKVALVDQKTASTLFGGEDALGSIIEVKGEPFVVVGITAKDVSTEPVINSVEEYRLYSASAAGAIYIPLESWEVAFRYDEPHSLAVRASSVDEMTVAGNGVAEAVNAYAVTSDDYAYAADNLLDKAASLQNLSKSANDQLLWIAGISLLVGGIGVMNIMLVSVTERTREIGLKLAIGASRSRIRLQFLTEASVLTLIGGVLGVAGGIGLAYLLSSVMGIPVFVSVPACLVAVAFSMVIGLVFGLAPALKASRLNPIEALRHE